MTRDEEIYNAINNLQIGVYDEDILSDNDEYNNDEYDGSDMQNAFYAGAKWADENPKSPWISVDEDLPCNHEELMSKYPFGYKKKTVNVLTLLPNGNVVTDSMGYREKWWNGWEWDGEKWEWESLRRPTHWVPIPKLSKE